MSDLNLLLFGCVVTFIAVGGAYEYLRESFTGRSESSRESGARIADAVENDISEVA